MADGFYTPNGQWISNKPFASLGQNGQVQYNYAPSAMSNPLAGFGSWTGGGQVDPTYAYGINAGVYNNMLDNSTARQNAAIGANTSLQNNWLSTLGSFLGNQYNADTQYNIAGMNNQGETNRLGMSLENALKLAGINTQSAQKIAETQAGASRYGADRGLDAANAQAGASRYGTVGQMLASLFGSQQANDASKFGSAAGLQGQMYNADTSARLGSMNNAASLANTRMQTQAALAPTQAGLYRFNNVFPLIRDLIQGAIPRAAVQR